MKLYCPHCHKRLVISKTKRMAYCLYCDAGYNLAEFYNTKERLEGFKKKEENEKIII